MSNPQTQTPGTTPGTTQGITPGITQYFVASSIDGFIADAHNGLDWLLQFNFAPFQARYDEFVAGVGAIVMGSATYEWLQAEGEYWPYGSTPTWVLTSRELARVAGGDIRFQDGDVARVHAAALREAQGKNVWVLGGGTVAAQFVAAGLLDEMLLTIVPVALGSGTRLLPLSEVTAPLTLRHTIPFENGAVELGYSWR